MFREIPHLLLASTVHHQDGGFSTVITQIGRVPTQLEVDVEHQVLLVGVGNAVGPQHGALVDDDVGGGGGALTGLKRPLDAHGVAALVARQHHFDGGQIRATVGFGNLDIQFVRLSGMEPRLASVGPRKGVRFEFRRPVNGELVHEQLLAFLGAPAILKCVA